MSGPSEPSEAEAPRRRLRLELRRLRQAAGWAEKAVADELGWEVGRIIRLENGTGLIFVPELHSLLELYGVSDSAEIERLESWVRNGMRQPWHAFSDVHGPDALDFFTRESTADEVRHYQPLVLPGLVQTADYAREVLTKAYAQSPGVVERLVECRLQRQALFDRQPPADVRIVIDEAAAARPIGTSMQMSRQARRLTDLAQLPHVTIQIVPLRAGAQPGLTGPFCVLSSEDPQIDGVLYRESGYGDQIIIGDQEEVANSIDIFTALQDLASDPDQFAEDLALVSLGRRLA